MKQKIRRGLFESNSSSSHSLIVTKNDHILTAEDFERYPEHVYVDKNGVWSLGWRKEELEFDRRPFKFLCTFEEKVMFTIASLCGSYFYNENAQTYFEWIEKVVCKINPEIKKIKLPTQEIDIWKDADGNEILDYKVKTDYSRKDDEGEPFHYYIKDGREIPVYISDYSLEKPYYGYIDHQSMGLLQGFLKKRDISLEEFLGNRKYVVVIDGDEYNDWESFKYSGIIDVSNIEEEFDGSDICDWQSLSEEGEDEN